MQTLPLCEPLDPHAWTRQPSGTWMNAPFKAPPFRNMRIVPAGLLSLPLVLMDDDGSKVVHSHCGHHLELVKLGAKCACLE